jgi:hypothetical protein
MDNPDTASQDSWTSLFVETAQEEHQKRQEHTADTQQAIQEYMAAAARKIKDALGPEASTLFPGGGGPTPSSAAASRPRTRARAR